MNDKLPKGAMARTVAGNTFRYLFFGAARNWFRNIGSIAPALGSMTLLLLMAGIAGLTGFAINNLERVESGQASLLHVYIRDGAPSADVNSLWDRLAADPRIAAVDYVTTGQALERAQRMPGLPQLADASQSNPFPASLDVQVKNIDDVAAIAAYVRTDTAVDPVYPTSYDKGAYQRIQAVIFGVAVAGLAFLAVLGFVAVTVTINSVRAAIHSRRDEVTIMQLVGAPRWMVRGPFVVEGAITGALSVRQFGARQAQREGARLALGGEHPGGQPRQPHFLIERRRQLGPVEIDSAAAGAAFELLGVPAAAARYRLPRNAVVRIAPFIRAQAAELGVGGACRALRIDAQTAGRQGRSGAFGRRIDACRQRKVARKRYPAQRLQPASRCGDGQHDRTGCVRG